MGYHINIEAFSYYLSMHWLTITIAASHYKANNNTSSFNILLCVWMGCVSYRLIISVMILPEASSAPVSKEHKNYTITIVSFVVFIASCIFGCTCMCRLLLWLGRRNQEGIKLVSLRYRHRNACN